MCDHLQDLYIADSLIFIKIRLLVQTYTTCKILRRVWNVENCVCFHFLQKKQCFRYLFIGIFRSKSLYLLVVLEWNINYYLFFALRPIALLCNLFSFSYAFLYRLFSLFRFKTHYYISVLGFWGVNTSLTNFIKDHK